MSDRLDFIIKTKEDLINAVHRVGFLPLFRNSLPGFSVEDHVDPSVWFTDEPGVWEWKGPAIQEAGCAYGKFFENKAAFISAEWFPDFANYRRDGYDFDARFDDELASYKDKQLFDLLDARAPVLSKTLKRDGNYKKGGATGFDTSINRLQAQGYVLISNFVYLQDRHGKEYGWGVAEYSTPEKFFGDAFTSAVYQREPAESYQRMLDYFHEILPDVSDKALRKFFR
ncbi:MAG: hypothetical protein LUC95_05555 [Lachnospiraceae bacterium]|nr:hypothetical protein [Lachnospiraceae bacterium]